MCSGVTIDSVFILQTGTLTCRSSESKQCRFSFYSTSVRDTFARWLLERVVCGGKTVVQTYTNLNSVMVGEHSKATTKVEVWRDGKYIVQNVQRTGITWILAAVQDFPSWTTWWRELPNSVLSKVHHNRVKTVRTNGKADTWNSRCSVMFSLCTLLNTDQWSTICMKCGTVLRRKWTSSSLRDRCSSPTHQAVR